MESFSDYNFFESDGRFDDLLSRALNNNQHSNLDDFIEFQIYVDRDVPHGLKAETVDGRGFGFKPAASLTPLESARLDAFNRLLHIQEYWAGLCSQYSWTCCPLVLEVYQVEAATQQRLHPERSHVRHQKKTVLIAEEEEEDCGRVSKKDHEGQTERHQQAVRFEENVASTGSSTKHHHPDARQTQSTEKPSSFLPASAPPCLCLRGRANVGDNTEEEWFVIHMLRQLSQHVPDIAIAVQDVDGDILLIECALHVPSWLNPSTSRHRVWLKNGQLQIIPKGIPSSLCPPVVSPHSVSHPPPLSLPQALSVLSTDQDGLCVAKPAAQKCLQRRLKPFEQVAKLWLDPSQVQSSHLRRASHASSSVSSHTTSVVRPESSAPSTAPYSTSSSSPSFSSVSSSWLASLCRPHSCHLVVPFPIAALLQRYPHLLGVALDHLPPPSDVVSKYLKSRTDTQVSIREVSLDSKTDSSDAIAETPGQQDVSIGRDGRSQDGMESRSTGTCAPIRSIHSSRYPTFDCSNDAIPSVSIRVSFSRFQNARLQQLRFRVPSQFLVAQSHRDGSHGEPDDGRMHRQRMDSHHLRSRACDRGAKVCLGLLSAFASESCSDTASLFAFFWEREPMTNGDASRKDERDKEEQDKKERDEEERDSLKEEERKGLRRIRRFISLLEASVQNVDGDERKSKTHRSFPRSEFSFSGLQNLLEMKVTGISQEQRSTAVTLTDAQSFRPLPPRVGATARSFNSSGSIGDVRFDHVFKHCYDRVLTEEKNTINSMNGMRSANAIPKTVDCEDVLACSDDEDWLELNPETIESVIAERQREDQFYRLVQEDCTAQHGQADSSRSLKDGSNWVVVDEDLKGQKRKRNDVDLQVLDRGHREGFTGTRKVFPKADDASTAPVVCQLLPAPPLQQQPGSYSPQCTSKQKKHVGFVSHHADSPSLCSTPEFLTQFKHLLNASSGLEGVETKWTDRACPQIGKMDRMTRDRLRETLPSDLLEFLDDYEGNEDHSGSTDEEERDRPLSCHLNESDEEEEGSVSSTYGREDNWGSARLRELEELERHQQQDSNSKHEHENMDCEMREIMKLMDDELKQYRIMRVRKKKQNHWQVQTSDLSEDGDDEGGNLGIPNKEYFRRVNPMELSDAEISTILSSNMQRSRHHESVLDPGPATMMLKSLDCFNGVKKGGHRG